MSVLLEAASILWLVYIAFCLCYGEWENRRTPGAVDGLHWWAWLLAAVSVCYTVWFKWGF